MDSFGMSSTNTPFTSIGHSLDVMVIQNDITFDHRSNQGALIFQCNMLLTHLNSLQHIINHMV